MAVELCLLDDKKKLLELYSQFFEQKEILEHIKNYSNDAIVVLNYKKQIIDCSKRFQYLFKNKNVLGENFIRLMQEIVQLPNDFFKEKSYFLHVRDKELDRIFKADIGKYSENSYKTDRYIIILKDVTEQKEMQAQKDNFIATLTHDLKTPVRADILSLELLLKGHFGKLLPEQTEILQEILNSNKFMMNMLDTLLAKYKYESDGVQLTKSNFKLNEFIENITKELKCLFEERNITCRFDFSKKDIEISADKLELKRAISNILSNAIKFNKINGFVGISTSIKKEKVIIKIEDTGIGITPDKMEHIFDRYVSYAKRFRRLGTGLGLYVAKKIIDAHNGNIEISSIPNEGSCFSIILPLNIN